jgi:hypothetical protein
LPLPEVTEILAAVRRRPAGTNSGSARTE